MRDVSDDYALLAVQGPNAFAKLGLPPGKQFTFSEERIDGIEAMVNRTGYTGEDGCEILCMDEDAVALWDAVLARGIVPCGLGARDTLRLEASLPLHGNDIGPDTDAITAGLGWACALDKKEFTGADVLRRIKDNGPTRKLVSFVMEEKAIPRQGMPIAGGGVVTSGLALADARRRHRHGVRAGRARGTRHEADHRRPRQAPQGTSRQETDLREGGLRWPPRSRIPTTSSTTASTTGPASTATRPSSA